MIQTSVSSQSELNQELKRVQIVGGKILEIRPFGLNFLIVYEISVKGSQNQV